MDIKFPTDNEVKELFFNKVKAEIEKYCLDVDFDSWMDSCSEEFINEALGKRYEDEIIEQSISKYAKEWMTEVFDKEDILDVAKSAMVEKLKEFSFEEVKQLMIDLSK